MSAANETVAPSDNVAALLAEHGEDYDADCHYHSGCSCGWSSTGDGPELRILNAGREVWAAHVAGVLRDAGMLR